MATWAPNTDIVIDNGFGGSRNGNDIIGIIPHHAAGFDARAYVAYANSRDSHPTYHIQQSGNLAGIVHPNRRPFSTANAIDQRVVTYEIDNSTGAPDWRVTDASIEALIVSARHHYRQSPRYGNGVALNDPSRVQREFVVGYHGQYVGTECPGPYVRGMLSEIVSEINAGASPAPKIGGNIMARIVTSVEGHAYLQTENGRAHIMHPDHTKFLERIVKGENLKFYEKELKVIDYYFAAANPAAANGKRIDELKAIVRADIQARKTGTA